MRTKTPLIAFEKCSRAETSDGAISEDPNSEYPSLGRITDERPTRHQNYSFFIFVDFDLQTGSTICSPASAHTAFFSERVHTPLSLHRNLTLTSVIDSFHHTTPHHSFGIGGEISIAFAQFVYLLPSSPDAPLAHPAALRRRLCPPKGTLRREHPHHLILHSSCPSKTMCVAFWSLTHPEYALCVPVHTHFFS